MVKTEQLGQQVHKDQQGQTDKTEQVSQMVQVLVI
jgi:hypothetical protein